MRKYAAGVLAVAALALYGATSLAQTAERATLSSTSILRGAIISVSCPGGDRPPRLGCRFTKVGTWHDNLGASGLFRIEIRVTGHPTRNTYLAHLTTTSYTDSGTFTAVGNGGWTIYPKRGIKTIFGKGHITGGTGSFRGLTGDSKCNGSRRVVFPQGYPRALGPIETLRCISSLSP